MGNYNATIFAVALVAGIVLGFFLKGKDDKRSKKK